MQIAFHSQYSALRHLPLLNGQYATGNNKYFDMNMDLTKPFGQRWPVLRVGRRSRGAEPGLPVAPRA